MIGFITMKNVSVSKTSQDSKGRLLIGKVTIEEVTFILVDYTMLILRKKN